MEFRGGGALLPLVLAGLLAGAGGTARAAAGAAATKAPAGKVPKKSGPKKPPAPAALADILGCAALTPVASRPVSTETAPSGPRVDVVFVVDTTGSMGAYLPDVKRFVTDTLARLLTCVPRTDFRAGMLVYRDKGDDYITKHIPLSRDYAALVRFLGRVEIGGGGDWPEHVAQAMHVAVSLFNWDMDPATARHVFLFGDAPAHTDYDDGLSLETEGRIAGEKHIRIHAVALDDVMADVVAQWKALAAASGGTYWSRSALVPYYDSPISSRAGSLLPMTREESDALIRALHGLDPGYVAKPPRSGEPAVPLLLPESEPKP